MKRILLLVVLILVGTLAFGSKFTEHKTEIAGLPTRSFGFTYVIHVPVLPSRGGKMRIWIPVPHTDEHQRITNMRIASPVPYRLTPGGRQGNQSAYFEFAAARMHTPFDIKMTFDAKRSEYRKGVDPPIGTSRAAIPADIAAYLRPDRLVPITGIIAELSREATEGATDPAAKARKIYDYVIKTMHYDHEGTGWGRGDAIFACTAHHGNCTDFHSLFIGMARAAGIPARFEIGFPLPSDAHASQIAGYHCWAEFYVSGIGWIPVDASEAWQTPAKHDYFFGAIDENRIRFSRGRDLMLSPPQAGGTVNYFVYPYAELDGKPFVDLGHDFSFHDLR